MTAGGITTSMIAANRNVASALQRAAGAGAAALDRLDGGARLREVRSSLVSAERELQQASAGASALRAQGIDLLDGAVHRQLSVALREATAGSQIAQRGGRLGVDARASLRDRVAAAEIRSRLASDAADRSLRAPQLRALPAAGDATGAARAPGGATYLGESGTWVDELGNPIRGRTGTWTGHDGASFDASGAAASRSHGGYVDSHTGEAYAGGHFI